MSVADQTDRSGGFRHTQDLMSEKIFEDTAQRYEQAARDLELAVKHLQHVANHFRDEDVPRASAHLVATLGQIRNAERILDELIVLHASKATV